ncbi:CyaA/EF/ExoY family adenylyl cyclase toxin [Cedecea davisae]|uniref:CyaA/EF/ExoY family adenylyl cyclase toxin n=1 Tax=Cedecea davisae TaxID=158484 RepID=UPI001D0B28E7|nr:CyaA/EF/ExoY family adenylyl cyclase toxin [Cedecea davisae]
MKVGVPLVPFSPPASATQVASRPGRNALEQQVAQITAKTGIVPAHLLPLQRVASEYNCIIGIRPVDKLATDLIAAGHPTKGFHIKGKSASWGPQAGVICVDQRFSKLERDAGERIAKFNQQTQSCIREGYAAAVPLDVSQSRLQSLFQSGMLGQFSAEDAKGVCRVRSSGPSGEHYEFEAQRLPGRGEARYRILHKGVPLEVLAPHSQARAFTADYDLMLIAPHVRDLGREDNLQVPDVSHQIFRQRLESYSKLPLHPELRRDYEDAASFYRKSDEEMGNSSQRVRHMVGVINQALVGKGEPVVHHATDSANPVTDPESNYPATFALPGRIGRFNALCVIENKDELAELVMQAKNAGYHVPLNPLWEKEVLRARSPRFDDARAKVEAALLARPR